MDLKNGMTRLFPAKDRPYERWEFKHIQSFVLVERVDYKVQVLIPVEQIKEVRYFAD